MLISPKCLSLFSALDVVNLFDAELVLDDFDLIHIPLLVSNISRHAGKGCGSDVGGHYFGCFLSISCPFDHSINLFLTPTPSHLNFPSDHVASEHQWMGIVLYYITILYCHCHASYRNEKHHRPIQPNESQRQAAEDNSGSPNSQNK